MLIPLFFDFQRHFGKAITREINKPNLVCDSKKVDELCSARCPRGSCQLAVASEGIDCARLAGITSPGKSHFAAKVCRGVIQRACGLQKFSAFKIKLLRLIGRINDSDPRIVWCFRHSDYNAAPDCVGIATKSQHSAVLTPC